jgi:hypothetical protein
MNTATLTPEQRKAILNKANSTLKADEIRPPKPGVIEPQLDHVPAELRERPQWVVWRYDWVEGRWNKVPYNAATGHRASSTNRETWETFDSVADAYRRGGYDGVGFVFAPDDPYCGADFDHCFDDVEGEKTIKPDAAKWVERFDSYTEVSPSGQGLHVIIKAKPSAGFNNKDAGRELYNKARYFCFTGDPFHDEPKPITERQDVAEDFIEAYDPKKNRETKPPKGNKAAPGLLTLDDITYDKSNPFEVWKAELGVKISADATAHLNGGGKIDCNGRCHNGAGASGLFFDPQTNGVHCNAHCELRQIGRAFKMPKMKTDNSHSYETTPEGIQRTKKDGSADVPLCNFTAAITGQIIRDDGAEQTDVYEITAKMNGVEKVDKVPAADFSSLKWVNRILGPEARIYPHEGLYVVDAIRALSTDITRRTVVAHTGWRREGDEWRYYHAGGAIGASGLVDAEVSLPTQLENFVLVAPQDKLSNDVQAVWDDLLNVTPNNPEIMVAGIGEVLCAVFSKPDFSGFDFGTTGTRKTQIQALKQAFFGAKFTADNLPESWRSSEYALETFASKIKDAAGCIDEFKPEGAGTTRERWHQKADYVLRGVANRQGRSTLRQDRSERPARIPQGLIFASGEELPNGESLRARLSIKEYDEKTVDLDRLTVAQKQAADGVYVRVMSAFIQWLATDGRIERLRESRDEEIQARRQKWIAALGANAHGRTPNNNAHLEWGWETFINFLVDRGVLDEEERAGMMSFIVSQLDTHARNQARYLQTANDALRFVELIQSAFISGKAHLTDTQGNKPDAPEAWGWKPSPMGEHQAQGVCIGAVDGGEVYLLPDVAYKMALEAGAGTDRLRATQAALQKRLREEGLLARTTVFPDDPQKNRNTVKKRIKGSPVNALCFRAATFEGVEEAKAPNE